jgi:hypothetical protein
VVGLGDRSSPWDIDGGRLRRPARGQRAAYIAGRLPVYTTKGCAHHNSAVRRRASVDALGSGPRDRPRDTWGGCGEVEDVARVPRVSARRGTGGSYLEAVGIGPTWTQRGRGALRAAQPSRQDARRAVSALECDLPVFQPVNPTLTVCFSKNLNCATKTVDTKVVDETSLYNICKGRPMIFSTV